MGLLTKDQIRELIAERGMKTTEDISLMLKDLFGETLQEMMEAEMDTTLGYGKNQTAEKRTGNRRNGHSSKTVISEYGESEIEVPRDRDGEHEPLIIKKHQKNLTGIEEQVIAMYSKGMTVRDIQDHLNRMYGVDVSPTLISNVTNKIMPMIKEWQNRPLESIYAAVFLGVRFKFRVFSKMDVITNSNNRRVKGIFILNPLRYSTSRSCGMSRRKGHCPILDVSV